MIRSAAVAGSWYPDDPRVLASEVDEYLTAAGSVRIPGRVVGLLSPHAGLIYSGPVAAHGYGLLRGMRGLTVVLVGPCHRVAFDGLALYTEGAWATPLGVVPIDEGFAKDLLAADRLFAAAPHVHRDEHSLEMQLPFLARLVADLRIVPILMGTQSRREVDTLVRALADVAGRRPALFVASSDLSHFHSATEANAMDAQVVECVSRYDAESLMRLIETSHEHACGGGPMVAVMRAARACGAIRAHVLRYADSGDVGPRDKRRVVGYLSAALCAEEE